MAYQPRPAWCPCLAGVPLHVYRFCQWVADLLLPFPRFLLSPRHRRGWKVILFRAFFLMDFRPFRFSYQIHLNRAKLQCLP